MQAKKYGFEKLHVPQREKKNVQTLFIMLLFVITTKLQSNPKFMTKESPAELDGVH